MNPWIHINGYYVLISSLTLGDFADLYESYDYSDYYDDYPQFSLTTIDPNRVHIKPLDEEINCTLADFQKRR